MPFFSLVLPMYSCKPIFLMLVISVILMGKRNKLTFTPKEQQVRMMRGGGDCSFLVDKIGPLALIEVAHNIAKQKPIVLLAFEQQNFIAPFLKSILNIAVNYLIFAACKSAKILLQKKDRNTFLTKNGKLDLNTRHQKSQRLLMFIEHIISQK